MGRGLKNEATSSLPQYLQISSLSSSDFNRDSDQRCLLHSGVGLMKRDDNAVERKGVN